MSFTNILFFCTSSSKMWQKLTWPLWQSHILPNQTPFKNLWFNASSLFKGVYMVCEMRWMCFSAAGRATLQFSFHLSWHFFVMSFPLYTKIIDIHMVQGNKMGKVLLCIVDNGSLLNQINKIILNKFCHLVAVCIYKWCSAWGLWTAGLL